MELSGFVFEFGFDIIVCLIISTHLKQKKFVVLIALTCLTYLWNGNMSHDCVVNESDHLWLAYDEFRFKYIICYYLVILFLIYINLIRIKFCILMFNNVNFIINLCQ